MRSVLLQSFRFGQYNAGFARVADTWPSRLANFCLLFAWCIKPLPSAGWRTAMRTNHRRLDGVDPG